MSRKKFFAKVLTFSLVLLMAIPAKAATAAPLSENYYYPGVSGLIKDYQVKYSQQNAGYNALAYDYVSPYYVRRTMNADAIFYISTHGAPGRVYCYNSSFNSTGTMSANSVSWDNSNYSLAALWGSNNSALSSIRLAYYSACNSSTQDSTYGKLTSKTTSLGALSSVGFRATIGINTSLAFDKAFFNYATVNNFEIADCAYRALQDVRSAFGNPNGVDYYEVYYKNPSNPYVYLKPASYGN